MTLGKLFGILNYYLFKKIYAYLSENVVKEERKKKRSSFFE